MSGTAEQEERAKWRANERTDRAEAEVQRLRAAVDREYSDGGISLGARDRILAPHQEPKK